MKILKISTLLIVLLLTSCKKDDNSEAIATLTGHWHVLSFEPDNSTDIALLTKDVITTLEKRGCDAIEFTFKSNGYVSYTNMMPLLNASTGEEGTQVECARDGATRSGTFDFDYKNLTLNLDNETITFNATIEGEYIALISDSIVLNGQTVSGKLLFKLESGD